MSALFPKEQHRHLADSILAHILKDTQTYLGIKTLLSLIAAISSWIVMKSVGLDFAEFWALLILRKLDQLRYFYHKMVECKKLMSNYNDAKV